MALSTGMGYTQGSKRGHRQAHPCSLRSNANILARLKLHHARPLRSQAAPATPGAAAVPAEQAPACSLPSALRQRLDASSKSWLDRCISAPLEDELTGSRIHVLGVTNFGAPTAREDDVEQVLDALRPSVLAIEQPFDAAAMSGMPYPAVLQQLKDLLASQPPRAAIAAQLSASLAQLDAPPAARIGKDLFDPFETFGLFSGSDLVLSPQQLPAVAQLFGFVPGEEYARLIAGAEGRDIQVSAACCCRGPGPFSRIGIRTQPCAQALRAAVQVHGARTAAPHACIVAYS